MLNIHSAIASVFGIGFIKKGSGTVAALLTCLLVIVLYEFFKFDNSQYQIVLVFAAVLSTFLGRYSSSKMEPIWGEDSSKIVIDEVAGMLISLCIVPFSLINIGIAFLLFRLFDIYKPLYIRYFEKYRNGWGVMLDDVAAGVWANIFLQIILFLAKIGIAW